MRIIKIFPIIAMLLVVFMAGCKKDGLTSSSSMATSTDMLKSGNASFNLGAISTDPINGAIGVPIDKVITVTINKSKSAAKIIKAAFTLYGKRPVAGTVAYTDSTATFTPAANLAPNTLYKVTVYTSSNAVAVKDSSKEYSNKDGEKEDEGKKGSKEDADNSNAKAYTWSFTTGTILNSTIPVVVSTDPINNATGVALNKVIGLTFSSAMDPLTINASTLTVKQGATIVAGTIAYSGTTATFTPSSLLTASSVYTATITTGAKSTTGSALAANTVWNFTTLGTTTTPRVVNLGTAGNYVILAKSAITNIATSAITGDIALSPAATSYITGFALIAATGYSTSTQVSGKVYAADMAAPTPINLTTAVNDMITAYNDIAGRVNPDFTELGTGNIGGKTLTAGLYKWSSAVTIPSTITISGGANDVWIFQIAGNLTMSSAVNIILTGGAQAKNIIWQVAGEVTLGTTSHFEGVILSKTAVTLQTGASLNGKIMAQTLVALDQNKVTLQ